MIIVYCINEKAHADPADLFCEEHYWIQIITLIYEIDYVVFSEEFSPARAKFRLARRFVLNLLTFF